MAVVLRMASMLVLKYMAMSSAVNGVAVCLDSCSRLSNLRLSVRESGHPRMSADQYSACRRWNVERCRLNLNNRVSSGIDSGVDLRGSGSVRSSHQTRSRPIFVFVFGAENGLGPIWSFSVFFRFRPKMIFIFVLFFVFIPKISFALGRKCYVRN